MKFNFFDIFKRSLQQGLRLTDHDLQLAHFFRGHTAVRAHHVKHRGRQGDLRRKGTLRSGIVKRTEHRAFIFDRYRLKIGLECFSTLPQRVEHTRKQYHLLFCHLAVCHDGIADIHEHAKLIVPFEGVRDITEKSVNAMRFDVLHRSAQNLIVTTHNGLKLTALLFRQLPISCHHVKNGGNHR